MGHHHTPVSVDPQQEKHARHLWENFLNISKWSIVGIVIVLIGLTLAFVG